MGNIQKLFNKVRNNPRDVRFTDICKLAESFGFTYRGGKGSHSVYTRKGVDEILNFQNVNGKVKPYQQVGWVGFFNPTIYCNGLLGFVPQPNLLSGS